MSKPEIVFKVGAVWASIFKNILQKNGQSIPLPKVVIEVRYKDKTGVKEGFVKMGAAKPKDFDNWSNRELWTQAFVVDHFGSATGSGDSSIAGFLSAFLCGRTIEDALKYATCVGFQNVRVLDAVSGIKTWDETTAMLKANMPMIDAHIEADGWKYAKDYALWTGPCDNKFKK